jgi:hypothetical protein
MAELSDAQRKRAEARRRRRREEAQPEPEEQVDESASEGSEGPEEPHHAMKQAAKVAAASAAVGAAAAAARALTSHRDDGDARGEQPVAEQEPAEAANAAEQKQDDAPPQREEPDRDEPVAQDSETESPEPEEPVARDSQPPEPGERDREHDERDREPVDGARLGDARQTAERAREQLQALLSRPVESVSAMERTHDGWVLNLEVLELSRVPNSTDVLASYEMELDDDLNLRRYQQVRRYHRADAGREGS